MKDNHQGDTVCLARPKEADMNELDIYCDFIKDVRISNTFSINIYDLCTDVLQCKTTLSIGCFKTLTLVKT